jgi:ubiquitin carboxyl-terminal hydrolase L5
MLKDMGVRGVKVNEVYSMDDNDMAMLPQPVHALIFLFRYQGTDKTKLETECPKQVWYAEQVPDFACATFALLNIINNIPGLEMGQQLRAFKQRTQDMTPRLRGDAIDEFTFVKRIHNSFARDEDLLNADAHLKEKLTRTRKEQAVAKAQKTKAANAAARAAKANPPEEKVSEPVRVIKRPSEAQFAEGTRAPRSSPSDEETAKSSPAAKSSLSAAETPKEESLKGTRTSSQRSKLRRLLHLPKSRLR